jgi:hypothetical protein
MKKLFITSLLLFLIGSGSFLFAQGTRVVEIQSLGVDYGAEPPTVTFAVYWLTQPVGAMHRDTVWVFVDYALVDDDGTVGQWTPASLTTVAPPVGAGTVVPGSLNGRGFYLAGNPLGAFSSTLTVTLSTDLNGKKFSWCAYATDYPPIATEGNGHYVLHGTPRFIVNDSVLPPGVKTYDGGCIESLSDATGCPGWIPVRPSVSNLTASPTAVCPNEPVTLEATATNAAEYCFDGSTWVAANTFTVYPSSSGTYNVVVKNSAGCTASYDTPASVTVHPVPVISAYTASPSTICVGASVLLEVTATGATSYSFGDDHSWTLASTATFAPTKDTAYSILVKNDEGCTATFDAASVTVYPLPVPTFSTAPAMACAGSEVTVVATGGSSYCFTRSCSACIHNPYVGGNGSAGAADCDMYAPVCTFSPSNSYTFTMPESGSVTISVTVRSNEGCTATIDTTITTILMPTLTLTTGNSGQTVTFGNPIDTIVYLTTNTENPTVSGLPAGVTYSWASDSLTITGTPKDPFTYTVQLACSVSATGTIGVRCSAVIGGVRWACSNVDAVYTFASGPGQPGMIYQRNSIVAWPAANVGVVGWYNSVNSGNPCPAGWRLPTSAELSALINSGSTWLASGFALPGRIFGGNRANCTTPATLSGQCVFIPAAGYRETNGNPLHYAGGINYWSSSGSNLSGNSSMITLVSSADANGMSVRCVQAP